MALVQPITNVQPPSPSVENNVGSSYMNPYNVDSFMNKLGNAPMDYAGLVEYNTRANLLASQYAYDANMASMAYQADINSDLMRQQYLLNQQSADTAYQRDSLEAQKKRDWDEMMSNTSYQRAVNDIKQSGLNPILAYTQGGASSLVVLLLPPIVLQLVLLLYRVLIWIHRILIQKLLANLLKLL